MKCIWMIWMHCLNCIQLKIASAQCMWARWHPSLTESSQELTLSKSNPRDINNTMVSETQGTAHRPRKAIETSHDSSCFAWKYPTPGSDPRSPKHPFTPLRPQGLPQNLLYCIHGITAHNFAVKTSTFPLLRLMHETLKYLYFHFLLS